MSPILAAFFTMPMGKVVAVRECPSSDFIPTNPNHAQHILPQCHDPRRHRLSPTHFPRYFRWMKQSRASAATLVVAAHSVLRIEIQVGIRAPSVHEVHFQFTSYIYTTLPVHTIPHSEY